jgi:DNA-binding MarR family transcriptional regulator
MAEITSGRIVQDITRSTGLSRADFIVLMELNQSKDRCRRQRELLDYLEWDKTRLSHQLTRMAGRGLIERDTDSENVVVIRMTTEGHAQLRAHGRYTPPVSAGIFSTISPRMIVPHCSGSPTNCMPPCRTARTEASPR